MKTRLAVPPSRWQSGSALILVLTLLVVSALFMLVNEAQRSAVELEAQKISKTQAALAKAKEALIARAATDKELPGRLPCPEDLSLIGTPSEGQAQSDCGNDLAIGRLPWGSLGLDRLVDGVGEPLWYALSPGFRKAPVKLAEDTIAQLDLDGHKMSAIIFSPGAPLTGQLRDSPTIDAYLDGENADGDLTFSSITSALQNDRGLGVSQDDMFLIVARRALSTAVGVDNSNGLRRYVLENDKLPFAAGTSNGAEVVDLIDGWLPTNSLVYPDYGSSWIRPPPPATQGDWTGQIRYQRISEKEAKLSIKSPSGKAVEAAYVFP